jgi:DNA-binding transcriptional LysR family regulator
MTQVYADGSAPDPKTRLSASTADDSSILWSLNLRHLRALAEIHRRGSVSAAAKAVNLTQPAITQAVGKLEILLAVRLFERRADGMTATPAAELLAPRIRAALDHVASHRVTMAQMRALIAVADAGGYIGAGAATGLAQPSLHRAVQDLSVALQRILIERRGRGVTLTDAGRRVARGFRLAKSEIEAGLAELAALKGRETGRIAIGAMPLSRARLLPRAVAAFHRAFPDAHVGIAEGSYVELIEPLRDGVLDLLIGALRPPVSGDDLVHRPLIEDRPIILGRAGHPLAGTAPTLADLTAYPWTVAARGAPLRAQWERMFADTGLAVPRVPIECGSVITIRGILLDSDFLTLLSPDQVAVELAAGWLVKICDAPQGLVRVIGVTTRADWTPTALQRAFLRELEAVAAHTDTSSVRP